MEHKTKNEQGGFMKVGILGTGAYGLALAFSFLENTKDITMWTKFEEEKQDLVINGFLMPHEKTTLKIFKSTVNNTSIKFKAIPIASKTSIVT